MEYIVKRQGTGYIIDEPHRTKVITGFKNDIMNIGTTIGTKICIQSSEVEGNLTTLWVEVT